MNNRRRCVLGTTGSVIIAVTTAIVGPVRSDAATPREFVAIGVGCGIIGSAEQPVVSYRFYNFPPNATVNATIYESTFPNGPLLTSHVPVTTTSGTPSALYEDFSVNAGMLSIQVDWSDSDGNVGSTAITPVLVPQCPEPLSYPSPPDTPYVGMAAAPADQGYWLIESSGADTPFGPVPRDYGALTGVKLNAPVIGMAATPDGEGYWLVAGDGGVFSYGEALSFGSAGGLRLRKPVVGMAVTPDGGGYWLVAADGGVFAYGDARFLGSAAALKLNAPIVGIAPTADGEGYYLVGGDGGVFAYGDAGYLGSMAGTHLSAPMVGITVDPSTGGYWETAADGGVFSFRAPFFGSAANIHLAQPVVQISSTPTGLGYRLAARDGGIFNYGDAKDYGQPPPCGYPIPNPCTSSLS